MGGGNDDSFNNGKVLEFLYTKQSQDGAENDDDADDDWAQGFELYDDAVWFEPYHLDASEHDMQVRLFN